MFQYSKLVLTHAAAVKVRIVVHSPCPQDSSPNTWKEAQRLWGTGSINVKITEKPIERVDLTESRLRPGAICVINNVEFCNTEACGFT